MDWCGLLASLLLIVVPSPAAATQPTCGFPDCTRLHPEQFLRSPDEAKDLSCAQRAAPESAVRIACVGDSITAGYALESSEQSYPAQLQQLLDETHGAGAFSVTNLGLCQATMAKHTDMPYWEFPHYKALLAAKWDYVVIMLGTNDAKDRGGNWQPSCEGWRSGATPDECRFANDYAAMIDVVRHLGTTADGPKIYAATPPPLMEDLGFKWGMNQTAINDVYPSLIQRIAEENAEVSGSIDVFTGLGGDPNWRATFPERCRLHGGASASVPACAFFCDSHNCDQCHPNAAGYRQLAKQVQSVLGLGAPTASLRSQSSRRHVN